MTNPELAQFVKDGEGRRYVYPGKPGKYVPSVTTVLKLERKDGIDQYAADQTARWCVDNAYSLLKTDEQHGFGRARFRWRDDLEARGNVGTGVHETVEMTHTGGWDYPELDTEQQAIMGQFAELNEFYLIEPLLSEATLWSHAHGYAGTADGLWRMTEYATGDVWYGWIDLKTSKNTWPAHHMQLAALAYADSLMFKVADGEWLDVPLGEVLPGRLIHLRADMWKVIDVPDMDLRFLEFLGYRSTLAAQEAIKVRVKARGQEEVSKAVGGGF